MRAGKPLGHVKTGNVHRKPNGGQAAYVDGAEYVVGDAASCVQSRCPLCRGCFSLPAAFELEVGPIRPHVAVLVRVVQTTDWD